MKYESLLETVAMLECRVRALADDIHIMEHELSILIQSEPDVVLRELGPGDVFTHGGCSYILTEYSSAYPELLAVNLKNGDTQYMNSDLAVKKGKAIT